MTITHRHAAQRSSPAPSLCAPPPKGKGRNMQWGQRALQHGPGTQGLDMHLQPAGMSCEPACVTLGWSSQQGRSAAAGTAVNEAGGQDPRNQETRNQAGAEQLTRHKTRNQAGAVKEAQDRNQVGAVNEARNEEPGDQELRLETRNRVRTQGLSLDLSTRRLL